MFIDQPSQEEQSAKLSVSLFLKAFIICVIDALAGAGAAIAYDTGPWWVFVALVLLAVVVTIILIAAIYSLEIRYYQLKARRIRNKTKAQLDIGSS